MRTFFFVIVVIVLEMVSIQLDGSALKYIPLHIFVNYAGFLLSPLVVLSITNLIAPKKYVHTYNIIGGIYAVICTIGVPLNLIFGVSDTNTYFRSYGYPVFILTYLFFILFLMLETFRMYGAYQKSDKLTIIPLLFLTITSSSVQVLNPSIHITWLSVTFLVILYYTHCSNLWYQIDGLTGLLTQKVYLHDLEKVKMNTSVFIFDVDDFKNLNDTLGHTTGDKALKMIASIVLEVYGKYGTCYRIGGDEMSVILHKNIDENFLSDMFENKLKQLRMKEEYIPSVSIGCAVLTNGSHVYDVVDQADKLMYDMKRRNI